jgi:hypothetical protein
VHVTQVLTLTCLFVVVVAVLCIFCLNQLNDNE